VRPSSPVSLPFGGGAMGGMQKRQGALQFIDENAMSDRRKQTAQTRRERDFSFEGKTQAIFRHPRQYSSRKTGPTSEAAKWNLERTEVGGKTILSRIPVSGVKKKKSQQVVFLYQVLKIYGVPTIQPRVSVTSFFGRKKR